MKALLLLLAFTTPAAAAEKSSPAADAEAYLRTIRNNDLGTLKALSKSGPPDVRDRLDWTPLHFAALYGSVESVRILLDAGANPNARNKSEATPLIYAAYDYDKTRLLVEKGADVNAKTNDGFTPLWVAGGVRGNEAAVRYLIDKGADPKYARAGGRDYMIRAAAHQDVSTLRLLLSKGVDPRHANESGETALAESIVCDDGREARALIDAGSDVNAVTTDGGRVKNGPIEANHITPLMDAASCADARTVGALIAAGANVNALDVRHMTALMMAAAIDRADPEAVRLLIAAGADLNIPDRNKETALDWARKYRNPAIVALLEKAGAKANGLPPSPVRPADYKPDAREAITRASALLAKSNEVFFREGGGCIGCHHQPFGGRAFAAARDSGLAAEPRLRKVLLDSVIAERPSAMNRLVYVTAGGGGYDSFLYPLAGMADMGEPATPETDVMVHYIAENQDASGAWSGLGSRPPLQESSITRTMLAIYAMKSYGWPARRAEFDERTARARTWLLNARAYTVVDEADRLMGLWLAGAPAAALEKSREVLLKMQKPDGGWAQTPYLDSDAFGTSAALYTLRKTGSLTVADNVYRRGAQFLLDTQFPDGSWFVRSRVVKLQPYFQSAFPYDHDQWISNTATSYAVMALAPLAR